MERITRWGIAPELGVAALVGAAAVPVGRLFRAGPIGGGVVAAIALSVAVSWVLRARRVPAVLALGLSTFALVWYLSAVFVHSTLWGPFPAPGSLEALADLVTQARTQIIEEVAPVPTTDALRMVLAAGVWATAMVVHAAWRRAQAPLLAIAATIPLFALPGTIMRSANRALELGVFAAAAGLVLFLDERSSTIRDETSGRTARRHGWRVTTAVRVGIPAIAAAVMLAPMLPGFGSEPGFRNGSGGGERIRFNPLVAIKPTLDRAPDRVLFEVRTPKPSYYRLTSLDTFDGDVWFDGSDGEETIVRHDGLLPAGGRGGGGDGGNGDDVRQEIEIGALAGSWVPAAYQPRRVTGVHPGVTYDARSETLFLPRSLPEGMRYIVESRVPRWSRATLDRSANYTGTDGFHPRYLELPGRVRSEMLPIAREIAGDEPNPFRAARALQNHLRSFTYDENVAAGHSYSSMLEFLTVSQRGYCEQFAGTMAVLARALDIPARVVIGFAGGDTTRTPGRYLVTTQYAHAWVEVLLPQAGWVPFEPTPRAGVARVPSYALPDLGGDPAVSDPSDPTDTDAPEDVPAPERPGRDIDPGFVSDPAASTGLGTPGAVVAALALVVAVILAIGPAVRRARLRRAVGARQVAAVHYVDFLVWCRGAGLGRRPGETPHEHAARLGAIADGAAGPLQRLAGAVGEALYAPPGAGDATEVAAAAAAARRAVAPSVSRSRRVLATLGWGRFGAGRLG